jgi:DNA-binding LacI/PurR family transcriptional regulator
MTAVSVPYRQMGTDAASILLSLLGGDEAPTEPILLSPTLSIRESTASPSRR